MNPLVLLAGLALGPDAAPKPVPTYVRGLVGGGASISSIFDIPSTAVHLEAGFGFTRQSIHLPLLLNVEIGETARGQRTGEVTLGFGVQAIFGPLRLGGGADLGWVWFERKHVIGAYASDAFALATLDLFETTEHRAIFLGVRPSAGVRWGESIFAFDHAVLTWRGTAMLGLRF